MDWFYEMGGAPRGPVSQDELEELLRSGRLATSARVWRHGMQDWVPAASVSELRDAQPVIATVAVAATTPSPQGAPRLAQPESVLAIILLGVVTLGIYPLVRFYQAARSYALLAHGRTEEFAPLFTAYVVCAGLAAVLMIIGVGVLFWLAAVVLGALLLNRTLIAREAIVAHSGQKVELTQPGTHMVLWIVGQLTTLLGLGIVVVVLQAALFFNDHNAIVAALARAQQPLPAPDANAPAAAEAATTAAAAPAADEEACVACGTPLGGPKHFCANCGARVG